MKRTPIANLVPGRVVGRIELDPTRSDDGKILLLRQPQLQAIPTPPAGVILVAAAPFSHLLIRWLGSGVPTGLMDAASAAQWQPGERVVLDTACGEIRELAQGAPPEPWQPPAPPSVGRPVCLADGTEISLCASVSGMRGVRHALTGGAAAIGLVRSELLLPDDLGRPNAEHYRREFAALLDLAAPLSVTVRLLDLAVDKWPTWLVDADADAARRRRHGSQLYDERSIRELVDAQLTALAALGTPERLRLIWPSGARLTDFLLWHDDAQRWLPDIALGAMVESPLEMLALECWQAAADFVAVGCNDLLQHLSAADRDDLGQRRLLDPYRPELFRFLAHAVQSASLDPARLQLCGLLPQIDGVLPVLVGLGCRCFSGGPTLIPMLAQVLADRTLTDCKALAAGVCAADSSTAVRELLGVDAGTPWGLVRDNAGASG